MANCNLIGRTAEEIGVLLGPHVDRQFRVRQVAGWIIERHARSFEEMSDLPLDLRRRLQESFSLTEPEVLAVTNADDGTAKYLLGLADGSTIEGVAMPGAGRATLCLSSQTGCALGCKFCITGRLGGGRNLGPDEIVGQYRIMLRALAEGAGPQRINIVFMGMGEPLLNRDNLGTALAVLYPRVSPRRITVSTAGVLPGVRWLAGLPRRPKLAISLNAPDQERREQIMPIARRYPLAELFAELRRFPLEQGRRITFEYVLVRDFNAARSDARATAALLRGIPAKVNLIPINEDPQHLPGLSEPDEETIEAFATTLRDAGLVATVRRSRGRDVAGACGQLKGSC